MAASTVIRAARSDRGDGPDGGGWLELVGVDDRDGLEPVEPLQGRQGARGPDIGGVSGDLLVADGVHAHRTERGAGVGGQGAQEASARVDGGEGVAGIDERRPLKLAVRGDDMKPGGVHELAVRRVRSGRSHDRGRSWGARGVVA